MRYNLIIVYLLFFLVIICTCEKNISSLKPEDKISLAEASDIVIHNVIRDDTISLAIYVIPKIISSGDTIFVSEHEQKFYQFNFDSWFFFIDDAPPANWAHPCRYVFVNINNGECKVYSDNFFPTCYRNLEMLRSWPPDQNPFWT